jgi:hypothetical protein
MMFHGVWNCLSGDQWSFMLSLMSCRIHIVIGKNITVSDPVRWKREEILRMILNPASPNIAINVDLCVPPAVG